MPSALGGIAYGLTTCSLSRVDTVWVHPAPTPAEQERVKAECRKEAIALFGAGHLGSRGLKRNQYVKNCLIAEGFSTERVEEGGGE